MSFKIRAVMNGDAVWFQGIVAEMPGETLNFAWTTTVEHACAFGLKEAADATVVAIGVGDVEVAS